MTKTGVIRHLDNLGRIVIPKEIRNRLNIIDGDSLDIYLDDNKIILKKYELFDNNLKNIKTFLLLLKEEYDCDFIYFDKINIYTTTLKDVKFKEAFLKDINHFIDCEITSKQVFAIDINKTIYINLITNNLYLLICSNMLLTKQKESLNLAIKYIRKLN